MQDINRFTVAQIDKIINDIVPLVAKPEDYEFFRGVLYVKAENSTASDFAYFISKMFNITLGQPT